MSELQPNPMGPEELADPGITARRLHAGPRAYRFDGFDPPFYILSRYQDVDAVLRAPDRFLSGFGQGPNFVKPSGIVSDAPQHTFFRHLVQAQFLPRSIERLRPRLEQIASDLLDEATAKRQWDIHDDLAFPLPVMIICEIFGIPTKDIEQFKRWSDASVAALSSNAPQQYDSDRAEMSTYVRDLLRSKRKRKDDTLLSRLAAARRDGLPLSDAEAVELILQLFVAGNETTTSLITNFVWRFLSIDTLWAEFCDGRIDLERAINESLRFDPPLLGLFRTTSEDETFDDVLVPRHTKVMTHYGAANRDPAVFDTPHEFNPYLPRRKVMSFGLGIHVCLGMELARLEARVSLEALRQRVKNLSLLGDGDRVGPFLFWGRSRLPVTSS